MPNKMVTVEVVVHASSLVVWDCWTLPTHITHWAFASADWEAPYATNDVREGGHFSTRMQAKDGSAGFDFGGTYTKVEVQKSLEYTIGDGRAVRVEFVPVDGGVRVVETFELESANSEEKQRAGWQAILENFKKYVEETAHSL